MYQILYLEINILCMLILLYIMFRVKTNIDQQLANLAFSRLLISIFLLLTIDCICSLLDGKSGTALWWINNFTNASYMFLTGVVTFNWFLYVEHTQGNHIFSKGLLCQLLHIPLILLLIISYSSPWTHLLFYIDSSNVYHRGEYYLLHPFLAYVYMILSIIRLLHYYRSKRTKQGKKLIMSLFSFFILPGLGSIISVFTFGAPTIWPFATLSILMVYVDFQCFQVSIDGLTRLNNRRQFDMRFYTMTANYDPARELYLFMMDIDHFKSINDNYGHYEGDMALKETAHLLQQASNNRELFLARYGGDEFVMLFHTDEEEHAAELKKHISELFEIYNSIPDNKYKITLSIGYAKYHPPQDSSPASLAEAQKQLIASADKALYKEKYKHHH